MLINLTPHDIRLVLMDGNDVVIRASGNVARIGTVSGDQSYLLPAGYGADKDYDAHWGCVPVHERTVWGEPVGLPSPVPGTVYLVSALFAGRVGDRNDVLYPGTGPQDGAHRDDQGRVTAVTRLIRA